MIKYTLSRCAIQQKLIYPFWLNGDERDRAGKRSGRGGAGRGGGGTEKEMEGGARFEVVLETFFKWNMGLAVLV